MKRLLLILIALTVIVIALGVGYKLFLAPVQLRIPVKNPPDNYVLAELLNQQGFVIGSPPLVSGDILSATVSGITVYFSRSSDLKVQVRSLQLLLPKVTMEGKRPQKIDLRFTKAVITY